MVHDAVPTAKSKSQEVPCLVSRRIVTSGLSAFSMKFPLSGLDYIDIHFQAGIVNLSSSFGTLLAIPNSLHFMSKHQPSAEFNAGEVIVVATIFIVLEIVCVALRFWARRIGKVAWGWDDSLIVPGLIFCLVIPILSLGEQWPLTSLAGRGFGNAHRHQ